MHLISGLRKLPTQSPAKITLSSDVSWLQKKAFGALKFSLLPPAAVKTLEQSDYPTINLNEMLLLNVFKLLSEARTELRDLGFRHVWARNSTVYARFRDGSPVHIINSTTDLPAIAQLYGKSAENPQAPTA